MVNITTARASRHKTRTSTVNFYFDRRAINMLLRLVRRQITIHRWLLPWLVLSLLHIFLSIFPFLSLSLTMLSENVSLSRLFDSEAWHASFRPFRKIFISVSFLFNFVCLLVLNIALKRRFISHSFTFITAFRICKEIKNAQNRPSGLLLPRIYFTFAKKQK